MTNSEDWLQDPLRETDRGEYKPRKPKSLNDEQSSDWQLFHYTTRLKLKGANFFCAKVIDITHTPEDELRWYLDAFFFELMAAYDTLLQELNTVYAHDLKLQPTRVRWNDKNKNKFMNKLSEEIFNLIEEERRKDWFREVQWHRNTTTHHYRTPITSNKRLGSLRLTHAGLQYIDKEDKIKIEEISICKKYLSNMANYVSSVWKFMAEEFE